MSSDDLNYEDIATASPPGKFITMLYGEIGRRKTTTAVSMVNDFGLLVNADNSWVALKKKRHEELAKKVKLVVYEGLSQLEHINYNPYDTVILDTVSAMIDSYLDLLFDKAHWAKGYREKLISDHPDLKGRSTTAPIDYKLTRDMWRPVLNGLFALPQHIIFTSHVNEPIEGLSKDTTLRPVLPNKTWQIIGQRANIIGFIEPKGRERFTVNVDERSTYCVAKSQIDGIEGKMDLEEFIEAYREKI